MDLVLTLAAIRPQRPFVLRDCRKRRVNLGTPAREDLRRDGLDDRIGLVPHRVVSARMVEHEIGEPEAGVPPGEVVEGGDARQRALLGVADQVDPLDCQGVSPDRFARIVELLPLRADDRLGSRRRKVGWAAEGDPGVAVPSQLTCGIQGCARKKIARVPSTP